MKPFWRTFPDLDTSKKMLELYKEFGKKNRPLKMYEDAIKEIHADQLQIGCQTNRIEWLKKQVREGDKFANKAFTIGVLSGACIMGVIILIIKALINFAY